MWVLATSFKLRLEELRLRIGARTRKLEVEPKQTGHGEIIRIEERFSTIPSMGLLSHLVNPSVRPVCVGMVGWEEYKKKTSCRSFYREC